jgi:hypothetical protein
MNLAVPILYKVLWKALTVRFFNGVVVNLSTFLLQNSAGTVMAYGQTGLFRLGTIGSDLSENII